MIFIKWFFALSISVAVLSCSTDTKTNDDPSYTVESNGKIATVATSSELTQALLDDSVDKILMKSGTYSDSYTLATTATIEADEGVVINELSVTASGSKIQSPSISKLTVLASLGEGSVYLDSVEVADAVFQGGGRNSIHVTGTSKFTKKVLMDKEGLSLKLDSACDVSADITINKSCFIEPVREGVSVPQLKGTMYLNANNVFINVKADKIKIGKRCTPH